MFLNIKHTVLYILKKLTLLVLRTDCSGRAGTILWLLMCWFLASLGNQQACKQQPWDWWCRSGHCLRRRIIVTSATISVWRNYRNAYLWLSSRLQYFLCVSNGDIAVLHWAIDLYSVLSQTNPVRSGFKETVHIYKNKTYITTFCVNKTNIFWEDVLQVNSNWLKFAWFVYSKNTWIWL